jgi:putative tryptophan/tyrosine transport system substrate-binding protein
MARQNLIEGRDYVFEVHQVRTQQAFDATLSARAPGSFVIYSMNTSPGAFVRRNGTTAPHVFLTYSDPLADGWIAGYVRPGGSATGVVEFASAHGKRLDLLTRLVPHARRLAIVVEAQADLARTEQDLMGFERDHPGIAVSVVPLRRDDSIQAITARLLRERIQAAYVPLMGAIDSVAESAYRALAAGGIPAIGERRADIEKGAILAYEVDRNALRERIANQLALILNGNRPGDIPVHSPRKFLLTINMDAAAGAGVQVPRALLLQADRVIAHGR